MITSLHGSADFISIVVIVNHPDFNKGVYKGEERCVSSASALEPPGKTVQYSNAEIETLSLSVPKRTFRVSPPF